MRANSGFILLFLVVQVFMIDCKISGLIKWHWAWVVLPTWALCLPVALAFILVFLFVNDRESEGLE
jgi:hypothetical protein